MRIWVSNLLKAIGDYWQVLGKYIFLVYIIGMVVGGLIGFLSFEFTLAWIFASVIITYLLFFKFYDKILPDLEDDI